MGVFGIMFCLYMIFGVFLSSENQPSPPEETVEVEVKKGFIYLLDDPLTAHLFKGWLPEGQKVTIPTSVGETYLVPLSTEGHATGPSILMTNVFGTDEIIFDRVEVAGDTVKVISSFWGFDESGTPKIKYRATRNGGDLDQDEIWSLI